MEVPFFNRHAVNNIQEYELPPPVCGPAPHAAGDSRSARGGRCLLGDTV